MHRLDLNDKITEWLTAALHGHIRLERGNIAIAIESDNYLINLIDLQRDLTNGCYLRLDTQGNLITDIPKHCSEAYFLATQAEEGAWFLEKDIDMAYDQSAEIPCCFL